MSPVKKDLFLKTIYPVTISILVFILADIFSLPAFISSNGVFLPLHTAMEVFAIIVSAMVFSIAWYSFRYNPEFRIMVTAVVFLSVALLDFGHTLSYAGMPDFITPGNPQKGLVFWIAARVTALAGMILLIFLKETHICSKRMRIFLFAASISFSSIVYILTLFFPDSLPLFYKEESGLTAVKLYIEYFLILMNLVLAGLVFSRPDITLLQKKELLIPALVVMALSELCFTLYVKISDMYNILGHFYKVYAYFLIYKIIFVAGITEPYEHLKRSRKRINYLSNFNALTGLPNKNQIFDLFHRLILVPEEKDKQLAVVMLNLDDFKNINTSLTYSGGDEVILKIAERISANLEKGMYLVHYSPDQFLLLAAVSGADHCMKYLNDLQKKINAPMDVLNSQHHVYVTSSIGVSLFPDHGTDLNTLVSYSDTALIHAKSIGRNKIIFFSDPLTVKAVDKLKLETKLRSALSSNEFVMHYQPQMELKTGKIIGAEALIRWQPPGEDLVFPDQFIPIAEKIGLINDLGDWVIRTVCRETISWLSLPDCRNFQIAINLSATQLDDETFYDRFITMLDSADFPLENIDLEVTESNLMININRSEALLKRFSNLGVSISLDDFGTGYSSLSYLQNLSLDILKIDKSFVKGIPDDKTSLAIINSLLELARGLNLKIIGEGVENAEQLEYLKDNGCMAAQGYLIGRPVPAEQFSSLLENGILVFEK